MSSVRSSEIVVAVVGTGNMGMRYVGILDRLDGVKSVAIPARPDRARQLRATGYAAVEDLDEAVRMGGSLVIIATDTGRHFEDACSALEAGLDVLVEKPISKDSLQAKRLCAIAKEKGRKLFVGCVLRFSDSLNAFRSMLGSIGRLHSVRIECQSYLPDWRTTRSYKESYSGRRGEGGVLRDLIHEIDYAGWLFAWPALLQARVRNLGRLGIEADEAADLMWETQNGYVISITLDYLSRPFRRYMRAAGDFGMIEWDATKETVTISLADCPVRVLGFSQTRDDMLLGQVRAFLDAGRNVLPDERLATCTDAMRALAVCDAARRASAARREERVEY